MKNNRQATHNHKIAGAVVVLESTAQLAKVLIVARGAEFWVKLTDLTESVGGVIEKSKSGKKQGRYSAISNPSMPCICFTRPILTDMSHTPTKGPIEVLRTKMNKAGNNRSIWTKNGKTQRGASTEGLTDPSYSS